jgi:hypothetical protein
MARFEKSRCWIAAALVIVATTLFLSCNSGSKTAQGGGSGANEEYMVLYFENDEIMQPVKLEERLNNRAKEGWKVRAGGHAYVILAR